MKLHSRLLFLLAIVVFTAGISRANESLLLQRHVGRLNYVDGIPVFQFSFELNGTRYDSIEDLKSGIPSLKSGTVILFRPGSRRFVGEPLGSLLEYSEFGAYCEAHGLVFRVVRSGGSLIYPEEKEK
jgi:hypothetical protein